MIKKEWTVPPKWYVAQRGLYYDADPEVDCVLEKIPGCAKAKQTTLAQAQTNGSTQPETAPSDTSKAGATSP